MIQRDLVIIITDQERYPQHWPAGLRDQLMPSCNLADSLQLNNLLFVKTVSMLPRWAPLDAQLVAAMRNANAMPQNVVWQPPTPVG